MEEKEYILHVKNGAELMEMEFPPASGCVRGLIPKGVTTLSGASKIGKSWLALDLALDARGITFQSRRSNGQRLVSVQYESDDSDGSDDTTGAPAVSSLSSLLSLGAETGRAVRDRPERDG